MTVSERPPAARMMQWIQVCATGWQCDEWRIGLCYVQGEPRFVLYRAHQRMGEFTALAAAQQRAERIEMGRAGAA